MSAHGHQSGHDNGESSCGWSTWMPATTGTGVRTAASTGHNFGALFQDLGLLVSKGRPLAGCAFGVETVSGISFHSRKRKEDTGRGLETPKAFLEAQEKRARQDSPLQREGHTEQSSQPLGGPALHLHGINSHCHCCQQEAESEDPSEEWCLG